MPKNPSPFAKIEIFTNTDEAVDALRPDPNEHPKRFLPLPTWATPPEVIEADGVTLLRPNDASIREIEPRVGSLYRELISQYGRDRLVLDFSDLRPFSHPFHDDMFAVLAAVKEVNGRIAICGSQDWYINRLSAYRVEFEFLPKQRKRWWFFSRRTND